MTIESQQPWTLRIRASDIVLELASTSLGAVEPQPGLAPSPALTVAVEETTTTTAAGCEVASSIEGLLDICAPTVGTFYRSPEPGAPPFVVEGDRVRRGQQIGIVEAMKLMIPLQAEHDGQVVAVLMEDGSPVEYGDRLFAVSAAGPE